jgi:hypothetical protein
MVSELISLRNIIEAPFFSAYDSREAGLWEIVGRICGGEKLIESASPVLFSF